MRVAILNKALRVLMCNDACFRAAEHWNVRAPGMFLNATHKAHQRSRSVGFADRCYRLVDSHLLRPTLEKWAFVEFLPRTPITQTAPNYLILDAKD